MISLADFVTVSLRWFARWRGNHEPTRRGDRHRWTAKPEFCCPPSRDFWCPSAGSLLSAYREYELSALSAQSDADSGAGQIGQWATLSKS